MLLRLLLLLSVLSCSSSVPLPKVAICSIVREEPDIVEWITYHAHIGVTQFVLYDHASSSAFARSIDPYVKEGLVTHYSVTSDDNRKLVVYAHCLNTYNRDFDFLAFVDADEYIVVAGGTSLPALLAGYVDRGGLALNWRTFGSSGHQRRSQRGVLLGYSSCFEEGNRNNLHVKSIVNTRYAGGVETPHSFTYVGGKTAVSTNGSAVTGAFSDQARYGRAWINHYLGSREDFASRLATGAVDGHAKTWSYFHRVNAQATVVCLEAQLQVRSWRQLPT